MPSGRHGGSPGSHRSGGSSLRGSSGRSFGSRGTRSGFYIRPLYRTVVIGGGVRTPVPQKYQWLSMLSTLCLLAMIFCGFLAIVLTSSSSANISKIEDDYIYYQQMIEDAEKDPTLLKTATVVDKAKLEGYDKYYILYEFDHHLAGVDPLVGYSFSVYTFAEASALMRTQIQIAVNDPTPDMFTDSVPMDFKDMPLTQDEEYTKAVSSRTTGIIFFAIAGIALCGLITVSVVLNKKVKKDYEIKQQKEELEKTKDKTPRCQYCGNKISTNQTECTGCGAKVVNEPKPEVSLPTETNGGFSAF